MLKIIFFILFLMPICFMKKMFWMVQNMFFLGGLLVFFMMFNNSFFSLGLFFCLDLFSFSLIVLSFWICSLMITSSSSIFFLNYSLNKFLFNIFFLLMLLVLTFSSMNLFMFYLFFESSLIPTLFLILGWGYQPERLQAGLYLLFYTLFASLPLLMVLFMFFMKNFTLLFIFLFNFNVENVLFYFFFIFAFLVKMPMFLVHLWLPKAHVEAPISGSMILAGILLKLGGYGLLRVMPLLRYMYNYNSFFIIFSLMGGVLVSLICLRQIDLKSLVAYSSVSHMSLVIAGILVLNSWGWSFSYVLMISHGLCSSGLFFLVNIFYERLMSRSLMINKGMMGFFPSMSMWWFLLSSSNMAAPPSLNLVGEIGLINSVVSWSKLTMVLLALISFFSAVYSLYLYTFSQQGKLNKSLFSFSFGYNREFLVLFLHWFPLNILLIKVDFLII